jgi:hypothetical protein
VVDRWRLLQTRPVTRKRYVSHCLEQGPTRAARDAIIDAHRSPIKKVHPDHGGSDLLAQQVNEAKRVLQSGA